MNTSHPPEFDPDDVANLEQQLRESLVTQPWEAAVHSRVKAAVEREWQVSAEIARDRRRRARHQRAIGFAVAAGLAIVALMVIAGRQSPEHAGFRARFPGARRDPAYCGRQCPSRVRSESADARSRLDLRGYPARAFRKLARGNAGRCC